MRDQVRDLAVRLGRDPEELLEWWGERAAIREVDGGQPRADAERDAFDELRERYALADEERRGPRAADSHAMTARKKDRA